MSYTKLFFPLLFLFIFSACQHDDSLNESAENTDKKCPYTLEKKHLEGTSMEPLLKNGSSAVLMKGFYCDDSTPQKGDVVAGIYGGNRLPLIKTVVATSFDVIHFSNTNLIVNGQVVKNSAGTVYVFSSAEQKMMEMYITSGHLPPNTVFVLGDNVSHSTDSRKFGALAVGDILGKFQDSREGAINGRLYK